MTLIESLANTASGFGISYVVGLVVYPILVGPISHTANLTVTCIFTALSIVRNYITRRVFEGVRRFWGRSE